MSKQLPAINKTDTYMVKLLKCTLKAMGIMTDSDIHRIYSKHPKFKTVTKALHKSQKLIAALNTGKIFSNNFDQAMEVIGIQLKCEGSTLTMTPRVKGA